MGSVKPSADILKNGYGSVSFNELYTEVVGRQQLVIHPQKPEYLGAGPLNRQGLGRSGIQYRETSFGADVHAVFEPGDGKNGAIDAVAVVVKGKGRRCLETADTVGRGDPERPLLVHIDIGDEIVTQAGAFCYSLDEPPFAVDDEHPIADGIQGNMTIRQHRAGKVQGRVLKFLVDLGSKRDEGFSIEQEQSLIPHTIQNFFIVVGQHHVDTLVGPALSSRHQSERIAFQARQPDAPFPRIVISVDKTCPVKRSLLRVKDPHGIFFGQILEDIPGSVEENALGTDRGIEYIVKIAAPGGHLIQQGNKNGLTGCIPPEIAEVGHRPDVDPPG